MTVRVSSRNKGKVSNIINKNIGNMPTEYDVYVSDYDLYYYYSHKYLKR